MEEILARAHPARPSSRSGTDIERDKILTAQESKAYGIRRPR
jgi:hypothetical protein